MKIPTWKKYLSYLKEFHIESTATDYNPHLYVSLRNGRYQLSTAHAVYSHEDLYDNFYKAFQHMNLDEERISDVLVLGLGLGSIPWMLERHFDRMYCYTAVEIDEEVIRLAHKYALHQLNSPIQTICADAVAFVHQCEQQFDMIAMDVFEDDVIPDSLQTESFLRQLLRLLHPQHGILLYNRLYRTRADRKATDAFFERFRKVFPQAVSLSMSGNQVLFSRPFNSHNNETSHR